MNVYYEWAFHLDLISAMLLRSCSSECHKWVIMICLQYGNLWMNQCKILYTFLYSYTIFVIVNVHSKCADSKAWHQNNTCHSNLQWFVIIWSVVPANKMSADLHPFLHAWQLIIPCSCVRFLLLKITNWFKKTLKPCLSMSCSWKPDNIEKVPLRVNWQDGQTSSSLGPWYYRLHWVRGIVHTDIRETNPQLILDYCLMFSPRITSNRLHIVLFYVWCDVRCMLEFKYCL